MIQTTNEIALQSISSTGDWIAEIAVKNDAISVLFRPQNNNYEMASGINYDNLATFISEVKADIIARGYNWSGN